MMFTSIGKATPFLVLANVCHHGTYADAISGPPLADLSQEAKTLASRELVTAEEVQHYNLIFNSCEPSFPSSDTFLNCTFTGPSNDKVINKAEIRAGSCDDFTEEAEGPPTNPNGTITSDSVISVIWDISHLISMEDKLSGVKFDREFCARADVYDVDSDGKEKHLKLKKADVTITFFWPLESLEPESGMGGSGTYSFSALLEGFSFDINSAAFGVSLGAYRCTDEGIQLNNDVPIGIGETLHFCVDNNNSDEFVISSINQVEIKKNVTVLTTPVKGGIPNLITKVDCASFDKKKCLISTLMTPGFFDVYAGISNIFVGGIANITYVDVDRRQLIRSIETPKNAQQDHRAVQQDNTKEKPAVFVMEFSVLAKSLPDIAHSQELPNSAFVSMPSLFSAIACIVCVSGIVIF